MAANEIIRWGERCVKRVVLDAMLFYESQGRVRGVRGRHYSRVEWNYWQTIDKETLRVTGITR